MANTDLNTTFLIGRMVRDAELRYTSAGAAILKGNIAVNRTGKEKTEVSYFDFKMFGKYAETMAQYLTKGQQVGIEGYLKQERWQAQDGTSRQQVIIGVENMQLLGSVRRGEPSMGNEYTDSQQEYASQQFDSNGIPF